MQPALYAFRYVSPSAGGRGVMFVGADTLAGIDAFGATIRARFAPSLKRILASGLLSGDGDVVLISTGLMVRQPFSVPFQAYLPINFATGRPQALRIGGRPVLATFEKLIEPSKTSTLGS